MTSLSTHDTKRGEDVRARIGVLSQIGSRWSGRSRRWLEGTSAPDGVTALFLSQNMFGVWPCDGAVDAALRKRLHAYAEGDPRSRSQEHVERPGRGVRVGGARWIDAVLDGPVGVEMSSLVAELAQHFWSDSLAQKLLAVCVPGIPDTYQGTERWEDSLVDPDNRRPVDAGANAALLESLSSCPPVDDWVRPSCGSRAGAVPAPGSPGLRRRCLAHCSARALRAAHVVAYGRGGHSEAVVAAARHTVRLAESGWARRRSRCRRPGMWIG